MKTSSPFTFSAVASVIAAAAIITPNAEAANIWTTGAPGGTSGGAIDFDQTAILDTGVASNDVYGTGGSASGDYTVSAWINPDSTAQMWFVGTQSEALHLGVLNNNLRVGHWGADSSGSTVIAADTWVHATFTYDADGGTGGTGLQSVYLNGALDGSTDNNAPNNNTGNIVVGGRIRNATAGEVTGLNRQPFDGQIDDLAIWDSALSAADVADLASGAQGAVALGAGAYWDFEDAQTGTTAANSGTGLSGGAIAGIEAIPEPTSITLLLLGVLGLVRRRRA